MKTNQTLYWFLSILPLILSIGLKTPFDSDNSHPSVYIKKQVLAHNDNLTFLQIKNSYFTPTISNIFSSRILDLNALSFNERLIENKQAINRKLKSNQLKRLQFIALDWQHKIPMHSSISSKHPKHFIY